MEHSLEMRSVSFLSKHIKTVKSKTKCLELMKIQRLRRAYRINKRFLLYRVFSEEEGRG